jgi:Mg2+-importing ATPase
LPNDKLPFWTIPVEELFQSFNSSESGLTEEEASLRLKKYGANSLKSAGQPSAVSLFLRQFKSPITLILLAAAILSIFLKQHTDASIILVIVIAGGLLSFWNERKSSVAIQKLLDIIRIKVRVIRSNAPGDIPVEKIVPGDIITVNAGDVIPGDCIVIQSKDLFVNESSLTGESYPAEKSPGVTEAGKPLSKQTNALFMGSHVYSGEAKAMVIHTGKSTVFGKLSQSIKNRSPETDFEKGIRNFGYLLLEITLILVILIFAFNVYFHRPVLEAFLFSLAIAVGLTPQLLPAIISVNLSHGAQEMCRKQVIVRRLAAIENFGSMNVLCSDKTGTITEGIVNLHAVVDYSGMASEKTFLYAYINAMLQSGFVNPIDEAIRKAGTFDISEYRKVDEVPYDFSRKRLSILTTHPSGNIMICKGAFNNILEICSRLETAPDTVSDLNDNDRESLQHRFNDLSSQGYRVLGVAYRIMSVSVIRKGQEQGLIFLGFLVLNDPPKKDIRETLEKLKILGISFKVITGDNSVVAASVCRQIGLEKMSVLTGPELNSITNEAFPAKVKNINIFAEIEPAQKERIIHALRRSGLVVGYLGDGVNDAPALHAADVSISVEGAAEVAKGAADIVLLEKDLQVLIAGVEEGRRTFTNTLKYIFMAASANFGNMFSVAGASLFLPFLPLLPKQILLLNLMTDFPELAIASDNVDKEMVRYPRHWDIRLIRKFMILFGLISSVFDYVTFFVLLKILHAGKDQFRTGWFIESIISASLIVLVIRTRKPFVQSRPGKYLAVITLTIVLISLAVPFTPLKNLFDFTGLPAVFYLALLIIVVCYILTAEIAKHFFFRRGKVSSGQK